MQINTNALWLYAHCLSLIQGVIAGVSKPLLGDFIWALTCGEEVWLFWRKPTDGDKYLGIRWSSVPEKKTRPPAPTDTDRGHNLKHP